MSEEVEKLEVATKHTDSLDESNFGVEEASKDDLPKLAVKPELTPSEKASYEFAVSIKPFKRSLHNLGKKELVRILSWLVEHPLQDENFKFKTTKEQNLANLAFYLLTRKLVIVRDGLNKPDSKESEIQENVNEKSI